MKIILSFLLTLVFFNLKAEKLSSMCYITGNSNSEEMFTLYEGTTVQCGPAEKGRHQVLFLAFIKKDKVYDGIRILSEAKLYDSTGRERGRTLREVLPYRTIEENDTCYMMELAGYARATCIDPASVVEQQLEKLLLKQTGVYPADSFTRHLHQFHYAPWICNARFTSHLLMETDIVKPRPGIRIVMVFEGDRAVAIFYRRGLTYSRFESVAISSKYSLVYLGSYDEKFKKELSDLLIPKIDTLY